MRLSTTTIELYYQFTTESIHTPRNSNIVVDMLSRIETIAKVPSVIRTEHLITTTIS